MTQHREIREQDEYYCPVCNKRWEVRETPPPCLSRREKGVNQINKLRKKYGFN